MAFPNMLGLFLLLPKVRAAFDDYWGGTPRARWGAPSPKLPPRREPKNRTSDECAWRNR